MATNSTNFSLGKLGIIREIRHLVFLQPIFPPPPSMRSICEFSLASFLSFDSPNWDRTTRMSQYSRRLLVRALDVGMGSNVRKNPR
jgi:hypothetical protein